MDKYSRLYYLLMTGATFGAIGLLHPASQMRIFIFSGCIAILALSTLATLQLARVSVRTSRIECFAWVGGLFVVGGVASDVAVTIYFSPDLAYESNPVVLTLLDAGWSLSVVYVIGLIAQSLFVILLVTLWCISVMRRNWYISELRRSNGLVLLRMFGLEGRWAWLGMGANKEIFVVGLGFLVPGIAVYRWYLALEWLGLFPISRFVAPSLVFLLSVGCHWLWCRQRLSRGD